VRRFQEPAHAKAGDEFKPGNGRYCFPLTVTDHASRDLLLCEALQSTRENLAITAFEQLFQERGLPQAIRSDNGVPLASPNGLFNLSKLSVWWLHLGIAIERIKPGHPQQNGRHARMHLTLKKEATRPPGMNSLQQQARFDDFVQEFNTERPHEALAMKCPAEIYSASSRPYSGLPDLSYPLHDRDVLVIACGRICMHRKRVNISTVLAGQRLGIKEVDDGICRIVSFMHYDLGFIDLEQKTCNPSTTPSAQGCHPSLRYVPLPMSPVRTQTLSAGGSRIRTLGPLAKAELGAVSAAAMQPETSQADARQQPSSFPGHAFSGHTKSKNPVEFRPRSYKFDGNRNARAMW
jgi:Integrase core domain